MKETDKQSDPAHPSNIGMRLSAIRVGEGLSQAAFAKSIGTSQRAYCDFENGLRAPPAAVITALFETYDLEPKWVLLGRGMPKQGDESEAMYEFLEELDKYYLENLIDHPTSKKNRLAVRWLETLRSGRASLRAEFGFLIGLLKD